MSEFCFYWVSWKGISWYVQLLFTYLFLLEFIDIYQNNGYLHVAHSDGVSRSVCIVFYWP